MTRDMERVGRIAQPFRNYQIDFEPPRITAKPLMFGVDKWLDEQNRSIASRFVKIVCQIEALYRKDAKQQVQAALMQEFIDQLAELSVRERIFSIADALIGGQPVAVSSGGGGNSDSDLRWDGRRPDEEEEAYRVILTKAPSTDKLQFYINFSDTVWIAAASMGAVGASDGCCRKEVGAPGRPKENGGRAYALPPFVMRGCALLRLPDQNTMTARETRFLLLRSVPYLYLFLKFTNIAWAL